jgi:hypothetical protein
MGAKCSKAQLKCPLLATARFGITVEPCGRASLALNTKGEREGDPFKEPGFFNALMRIRLGPKPADWRLKDALQRIST